MPPNTTRNAGRQLLVTRNRLMAEKDPSKVLSLKRKEAYLLLELGQNDSAVAVATSLVEDNIDSSRERAFLADILTRTFAWAAAEKEFTEAHGLCLLSGKNDKAFSLASGPLFLLAEARKDYRKCFEVAPIQVLRNRALRLSGQKVELNVLPSASPWREIAILENTIIGGNPFVLPGLLADWNCGEAEWRWRFVYEAASLAIEAGMSAKPWRKYLKQTTGRILDPRYFIERKELKRLLSKGFVYK